MTGVQTCALPIFRDARSKRSTLLPCRVMGFASMQAFRRCVKIARPKKPRYPVTSHLIGILSCPDSTRRFRGLQEQIWRCVERGASSIVILKRPDIEPGPLYRNALDFFTRGL